MCRKFGVSSVGLGVGRRSPLESNVVGDRVEGVLEPKYVWGNSKKTGEKLIVEVSSSDAFWGCRDEGSGTLVGEYKLGEILMGVRSRISEIVRGDFKYPEGWLLP